MTWSARAFYEKTDHGAPGVADAAFLERLEPWLGPYVRTWFRPTLEGLEHLPADGAYLIVANHSGVGVAEISCIVLLWWQRFGVSRPLAGFGHPIGFKFPFLGRIARSIGMIPSTYRAADAALEQGVPLLLFPGGDHEAFRPIWQANRVDFGGRKGFLRIAQKHGVPIVPLAIQGSHVTTPILWRSRLLAWLLVWPRLAGVKRVPVTLLGLIAFAACVAAGIESGHPWLGGIAGYLSWTLLPSAFIAFVPSRISLRLLPPISATEIGDDLDSAYARVTGDLQRAVHAMRR